MQKTYWWRVLFLFFGVIIFGYTYIAAYGNELGLCKVKNGMESCMINYNSYIDSLGFLSISIIITDIFLFFISDKIFLKWLRFASIWCVLTIIFISSAPVYTGGFMSFGPTKELISIWMGTLFVILSLAQFVWEWRKARKQ